MTSMLPAYLAGDRVVLESVSRRAAHAVRLGGDEILCRVLGRFLMLADVTDHTVAPHLALDGYWEPWTTVAMARRLRAGWCGVDIGANHGYFTLLMALAAGPGARVLAVEPNPRLAALIERTLDMNGLAGIAQVRACAAGARKRSRARLVVPVNRTADASLQRAAGPADTVLDVESASVDELTQGWPSVDFVKIDTEGSEPAVWQGMSRTLARNPGIAVVMEFKPASYTDAPAFLTTIKACGFVLRSIQDDGSLSPVSDADVLAGGPGGDRMLFLYRE
jgi:FkbM family methyltransferase